MLERATQQSHWNWIEELSGVNGPQLKSFTSTKLQRGHMGFKNVTRKASVCNESIEFQFWLKSSLDCVCNTLAKWPSHTHLHTLWLTWGRLPCCTAGSPCEWPRAAGSSVGGADPRSGTTRWCQPASWCWRCCGCPRAPCTHRYTHRDEKMSDHYHLWTSCSCPSATCRWVPAHWRSSPCAREADESDPPSRIWWGWPSHSSLCEGSPGRASLAPLASRPPPPPPSPRHSVPCRPALSCEHRR